MRDKVERNFRKEALLWKNVEVLWVRIHYWWSDGKESPVYLVKGLRREDELSWPRFWLKKYHGQIVYEIERGTLLRHIKSDWSTGSFLHHNRKLFRDNLAQYVFFRHKSRTELPSRIKLGILWRIESHNSKATIPEEPYSEVGVERLFSSFCGYFLLLLYSDNETNPVSN